MTTNPIAVAVVQARRRPFAASAPARTSFISNSENEKKKKPLFPSRFFRKLDKRREETIERRARVRVLLLPFFCTLGFSSRLEKREFFLSVSLSLLRPPRVFERRSSSLLLLLGDETFVLSERVIVATRETTTEKREARESNTTGTSSLFSSSFFFSDDDFRDGRPKTKTRTEREKREREKREREKKFFWV